MKSILFFFCSFSLFLLIISASVLIESLEPPRAIKPHFIFETDEYLKIILPFCLVDAEIRLVSKSFMRAFDDSCKYCAISYDERLKNLIETGGDPRNTTVPRINCIPFQVPLLFLLREFFGEALKSSRNDLNSNFPYGKRRSRSEVKIRQKDSERFLFFLSQFIQKTFYDSNTQNSKQIEPLELYRFYKWTRGLFPRSNFATEIIPMIHFPIEELLYHAAKGSFKEAINYQLFFEFQNFIPPYFIFEAFKSNMNLVSFLLSTSNAKKFAGAHDHHIRRPMHYAALFGNIRLMQTILDLTNERHLNIVDRRNEKPIHKAAANGHLEAFKWLYEHGSIVNRAGHCNPPILRAVKNGHIHIVSYILTETNYNSINDIAFNKSLLRIAFKKSSLEMVTILRNSPRLWETDILNIVERESKTLK